MHQPGDQAFGLPGPATGQGRRHPGRHRTRDHGHGRVQALLVQAEQPDAAIHRGPHALPAAPAPADLG
jgi:hypothetical protein